MHSNLFLFASLLGIFGTAIADDCMLVNGLTNPNPAPTSSQQLCLPQGEGQWTFAMVTSLSVVPSFSDDAGNGLAGAAGSAGFLIYDNACVPRAYYPKPGCGIPYVAKENFLPLVLTVEVVDFDIGQPYFSFAYGDGLYSIKNNHCVCSDMSHGLTGAKGCRCAFPLDGHFVG
ncbi:hypothetical protein FDECE_14036 [Fusarium decemcellulare]|nr:hypothetical protein FDECE_14036 [Fusarium decemcellulare]